MRTAWGSQTELQKVLLPKKKDSDLGGGEGPCCCPSSSPFNHSQVFFGLHSQFLAIKLM